MALYNSNEFPEYLVGQFLLGSAAGIYWPSAELAVPLNSENYPSSKGFALVRTADAFGISIGAISGTLFSWIGYLRLIYILDIFCMIIFFQILNKIILNTEQKNQISKIKYHKNTQNNINYYKNIKSLLISLYPILVISLLATSIFSLLQSGLPLDLVKGSLFRAPLNETNSGIVLTLQLFLILIFQWPVGIFLSKRNVRYGLRLSLIFLGLGCFLLSISSRLSNGLIIIVCSLVLIAIGITSFLPTATESIIQVSSISKRGLSMALFSQCFGVSSIIAPVIAGKLFDYMGDGFILWLSLSLISFSIIPLTKKISSIQ